MENQFEHYWEEENRMDPDLNPLLYHTQRDEDIADALFEGIKKKDQSNQAKSQTEKESKKVPGKIWNKPSVKKKKSSKKGQSI
ncbi:MULTISPECIES: hypothetical protein [Cyclobacteriaceae]|uniref:Uncharacterized protein n=2 Tax=Cyclobacteriaceae TaxID=563798 RepID=A0ABV9T0Q3_9BACT